jgi:hypothetical protein
LAYNAPEWCCASGKPCQVQNLELLAPVRGQVQKLEGLVCAIIPVANQLCQVKNFLFD